MATGGRYPSTKERVNDGRICRIVVELCTDVMRKILTKLVVPSQLLAEVRNCSDLRKLAADELHRINNAVAGTSYGKFDISFLYKLIRAIGTQELRYELDKNIPANSILAKMQSVPASLMAQLTSKQYRVVQTATDYSDFDCGLLTHIIIKLNLTSVNIPSIIPSANDWGGKSPPKPTDVKLGDDIERIRLIRNTVYGHVSDTCVTDSEFQKYLTELTGVMQRMDQEFNTGGQYLRDLNDIETVSLDDKWEMYESTIQELAKREQEIKDRLEKQEESTVQLEKDVTVLNTSEKQMKSRLEKQEDSIGELQTCTKQIESRLEKQEDSTGELQTGVKQIESRLEKQEDSTGELQTCTKQMESRLEKQEDSTGELQTGVKQMESRLEKQEDSTGDLHTCTKQMESRLQKQEDSTGKLQKGVGSLSKSITEIGGKVDEMQTQVASLSLPQEISPRKLEDWRKSDNTFYPTKATTHMSRTIKSRKKVLACGLPGSGKTAAIHHIALKLKSEGFKLCCVQTFNEVKCNMDKFSEDEKQVYVIDDVFGVHGVDELKRKQWCDDNKDDLERCLNNPNISILCSSRIQVIQDPQLRSIKSRFTIVNISEGAYELSKDEQAGIFRNHAITKERKNLLTENKNELKVDIKEKVREVKCPVGCFPLVCHLYTGEEKPKLTMEEYFNKPLNVIADHLEMLKVEDRLNHFCLLLCLIYDNKLPVNIITVGDESKQTKKQRKELLELCKLPVTTSREEIREKMDTLLQTFVKLDGVTYQFVHDIIHDAVIKHVSCMSSSLHQFIIRHCSSKFMRDRVHLSGVVCKYEWGDGHDIESCINIRTDSFTCWGERVLDIVRDGVRTSDQLYNDIDEGRCSIRDRRVWLDNPWRDVFVGNRCVHSTEGQAAIVQALKSSDVQTIMCTKGYCLDYGDPRVTGLHWAIEWGLTHIYTQTVSMLSPTQLREVVSIHDGGLVCSAIDERCGTDVIQALIVGGADVNTPVRGDTPLCSAIRGECGTDVIQALIVGGADVNTPGERYGTDVIQALIVGGVDVNTPDVDGDTPLCWAILGRCGTDVIQALIVGGADVNTPDVHGNTPLCRAIRYGCGKDVIQALIDAGADVNTRDVVGYTPLWSAIREGCGTDVIQALIDAGADVNTPDVFGDTPLYLSVSWRGDYKITQLLVDNGADINQCDKYGTSVLYKSQLDGHDTITELLQSRGAVCMYKGKRYTTITDIPDSEVNDELDWEMIQKLKEKQNVTK